MSVTVTQTYTVRGMTCNHCAASVAKEVGELHGVAGVEVDLLSGRLDVNGVDVNGVAVGDAVAEAGYELVDR